MISDEKHLVKKALKGDKDAFTALVLGYEDTLYGTAMAILKNREDAGDCIQEAIISAYKNINSLREERYFKTWMVRILMNRCYTVLKERKRYADSVLEPEAPAVDADVRIDVQNALSHLKEKDRQILTLYYFEDMPLKEIAETMGISEGAARLRLMRSRESFKEAYKPAGDGR